MLWPPGIPNTMSMPACSRTCTMPSGTGTCRSRKRFVVILSVFSFASARRADRAAVDRDHVAGHVVGQVGAEELDDARAVLGRADPAQRDPPLQAVHSDLLEAD